MNSMKWVLIIIAIALAGATAYLLWPAPKLVATKDPLKVFDDRVATFPERYVVSDGLEFFRRGGVFCDDDDYQPYDKPYIVPLLKRLSERFGMTWSVIAEPKNPDYAMSVYAAIPDGVTRDELKLALKEEQFSDTFKGDILQIWGHKHIALDFMTPEEVAQEMAEEAMLEN